MNKLYRTAQGRSLDIEKMRLQNEMVPAIGNMRVNARGDQLGPGGKIVRTREEIMDEVYRAKHDNHTHEATEGPIPNKSSKPNTAPSQAIPTSNKQKEFTPGTVGADTVEKAPTPKGGLAKAVAKAKKKDQENL
jgi:hypothetical protein